MTYEEVKEFVAERDGKKEKVEPSWQQAEKLLKELEKDEFIKAQYEQSAGVWEGYSIREHTLMAMAQFEKYFVSSPLPLNLKSDFFRYLLALHDIGKPKALAEGRKSKQHEYSQKSIEEILPRYQFSEEQVKLASAIISQDPIGNFLKGGSIDQAISQISSMANHAKVSREDFLELLLIFYQVDASSYTEDATIPEVVQGLKSLDPLFEFDHEHQKMTFSSRVLGEINLLRQSIRQT